MTDSFALKFYNIYIDNTLSAEVNSKKLLFYELNSILEYAVNYCHGAKCLVNFSVGN